LKSPGTSTDIGDIDAPGQAAEQYSIFIDSSITEANFTDLHIMYIGTVTATKDSSDQWTLDTFDTDYDGLGKFQQGRQFTWDTGLFGAGSGSPIKANGGTAPVFTTNYVDYTISLDGHYEHQCEHAGDGGTDGSGAVSAIYALPFTVKTANGADRVTIGQGWGSNQAIGTMRANIVVFTGTDAKAGYFVYNGSNNTLNSQYSSGGRRWNMKCRYLIDDGR